VLLGSLLPAAGPGHKVSTFRDLNSFKMADIQAFLQPAGFQQLMLGLLSQDAEGDQRKQAEAIFDQVKQHPDPCAGNLLTIMRSSPQVEHRSFAAIMLRKVRVCWSICLTQAAKPE
jgi:hypothetical protein